MNFKSLNLGEKFKYTNVNLSFIYHIYNSELCDFIYKTE